MALGGRLRHLPGTKVFIAGTETLNLADPEVIRGLEDAKIRKVFCLYPITLAQYTELPEESREDQPTLKEFYKRWNIDPTFLAELIKSGIRVSPLVRNPNEFRAYDSFLREARKVKGNILIQCFKGMHASGAYALYYLAKATRLSLKEAEDLFFKIGYRPKDLQMIEGFFKDAKIDIRREFERKIRIIEGTQRLISRIKEAKERIPERKPGIKRGRKGRKGP